MGNPAEEIVQIVDKDNTPTGAELRRTMRQEKLIHRATYILVFNAKDELFIQKRTMTKDLYPGYWSVAAGGVVLSGESYDLSARRELHEELGVDDTPLESLFHHYFESGDNRVWGAIYRCHHEGPFSLQKEEIECGMFISVNDILNNTANRCYTPDGLEILKRLQESS